MTTTTGTKKMSAIATVMIAVGLLARCSLPLQSRVAPSPPVFFSQTFAGRGVLVEAESTDMEKRGAFPLQRPNSRRDRRGGDEGRRTPMAANPGQEEKTTEEQSEEEAKKTGGAEEHEQNLLTGEGVTKTDNHGAHQPPYQKTAGAVVETGVQTVLSPILTADPAFDSADSSTTATERALLDVSDSHPEASNGCWIFLHLQKSGGSTVKLLLADRWKERLRVYDDPAWKFGNGFMARIGDKLVSGNGWNVVAGGYTAALRRLPEVEHRCQFFTAFRHPITRIVSAYFYCTVNPSDHACASEVVNAKDVSLLDFAKHWGNFAVRQMAMSFVASDDVRAYIRTPEARALHENVNLEDTPGWFQLKAYLGRPREEAELGEAALKIQDQMPEEGLNDMLMPAQELMKGAYTVGILEEWNTTLALFDTALGMPGFDWRKSYAKEGIQHVNAEFEKLKAETLEEAWTDPELKQYMQLDLLLYEQAVDVFHVQARSHGVLR